jgi:hypothetical protein
MEGSSWSVVPKVNSIAGRAGVSDLSAVRGIMSEVRRVLQPPHDEFGFISKRSGVPSLRAGHGHNVNLGSDDRRISVMTIAKPIFCLRHLFSEHFLPWAGR